MTDDRTLERAARSWLEEGPTRAPDEPVRAALALIDRTNQERDLRVPRRIAQMPMFARLAAAAVIVVALASGTYLVFQGQNASVGSSPSPAAPASASPQASAADPLAAYRTARNQICMTALQAFSDNNDLVGLYDPATTPERRAIVNANAQAIADAIAAMARDLGQLQPPAQLAQAHTTDVAHAQAQAAIFAAQVQLLRDGRYGDAAAQEVAAEAASNLRKPFETEYQLFNCP